MDAYIRVGIGVLILQNGRLLLGHRVCSAADTGGIYEPIPGVFRVESRSMGRRF